MWRRTFRFVGRYLAIGVLVGIGFVAVEESYMQLYGDERVEQLKQSLDEFEPGDEETVVMRCPFVQGMSATTLSETSFRIKRRLSTKQAVDPDAMPNSKGAAATPEPS